MAEQVGKDAELERKSALMYRPRFPPWGQFPGGKMNVQWFVNSPCVPHLVVPVLPLEDIGPRHLGQSIKGHL